MICTFLNILINPIRNLMIDVLLIGTIYNMIGQEKSFKAIIPFFLILIMFYLVTVFFEGFLNAKIEPIGAMRIKKHIEHILCENASNVDLAMFDNAKFYEENVFRYRTMRTLQKKQ